MWWKRKESDFDKFLEMLRLTGLLDKASIKKACCEVTTKSIDELFHHLVENDLLTQWQCNKLRIGKHRGFLYQQYVLRKQIGKDTVSTNFLAVDQETQQGVGLRMAFPADGDPFRFDVFDL